MLGWDANAAAGGVSSSGGAHPLSFMPQDQCVQSPVTVEGCAAIGSAAYAVGNLTSHGGPVMHSVTNHAIFWLPPGFHFDTPTMDTPYPNANDTNYEALVGQYFRDLSDTAYYSILSQYGDRAGAPGLATNFGGAWVDTSPYPNSEGSKANPLQDSDIEAEVTKAITVNGWSPDNGNNGFFVFTGQNVFGCAGSTCSYKDYCAYHSEFQASDGQDVVYADIPDPGNSNAGSCLATTASGYAAPNSGASADSAVNLVAHEGFESVTDPLFDGWYYQDSNHEVADECVWKFGSVAGDGSNIALNGHKYLVQEMWSNKAGGCYIPAAVSTIAVAPSYQVLGGGSGFTAPRFTYFSSGVLKNTLLSTAPQTLNVDFGSVWNVTGTLPSSTSTERWQIGQTAGGVIGLGETFAFTYYHQYLVNFGFGVLGGGSAYSAPSITITQFGNQTSATVSLPAGQGSWADAHSRFNYTDQLPGSSPNERWTAQSASGTVASAGAVSLQYYHQYLVPVSYTGGGSGSSPPAFAYSSLGRALNTSLGQQSQSLWLDAGAGYSAANPLGGSTATERWFSPQGSGTVSSGSALQLAYHQQYFISVQGGVAVVVSPQSPTGDGFYDSGSSISVSSARTWDLAGLSREALVSYNLDGGSVQAVDPGNDSSTFSTPSIMVDRPHQVVFASAKQYLVGFRFTDALGSRTIIPSGLRIGTSQPNVTFRVQGSKAWLDAGSTYVIRQVLWENTDVKPPSQIVSVDAPQNVTVAARVFDATLRVTDYLQIPISGASASIRLANGTSTTRTTGTDGTISLASIPLGRFNATVSYLGASQGISADVSAQNKQVDARLPGSLPDFGAAAGVAAAALIAYAIARRHARSC